MKTFLRDIVVTVIIAIVIFFLLQSTIQMCPIVGSCMEPNLYEKDRIIINKVVYHFNNPEPGDIIVFLPPHKSKDSGPYIKRVIGLPDDTVEIKGGAVYINGSPLYEPYVKNPPNYTLAKRIIAENEYFVLGDNRPIADDSHNGWTVPQENIIGKAWLSVWPPNKWGLVPNHPLNEQQVGSIE